MRTLDARVGISVVAANRATLHGLAPLETAHVVALDTVGAVWVLIFVVATAFTRVVDSVCRGISLTGILRYSPRSLVSVVSCVTVRTTSGVTHNVVKIARGRCLALRRGVARVPLRLTCGCRPRRGSSGPVLMR
jgi:hypothetical protein